MSSKNETSQAGSPTISPTSWPTIWTVRRGDDRRVRAGHPWVFSNELSQSPKGIVAGSLVELRDQRGEFLARGYGHPNSLIAFRVVTRDISIQNPLSNVAMTEVFRKAHALRKRIGLEFVSHRLIFGEGDDFPGLIVDRFILADGEHQVFVVEAHTSGADQVSKTIMEWLPEFVHEVQKRDWKKTAVIFKNDVRFRQMEGLERTAPEVVKAFDDQPTFDFDHCDILIRHVLGEPISFHVELLKGQKTGFFLDQAFNIELAIRNRPHEVPKMRPLRVLDLCCYVGQWATQFAAIYKEQAEITLVDASAQALEFAAKNVARHGSSVISVKADVLENLSELPNDHYDIIICDPPAFIKSRKDVNQGIHAYMKLNSEAMKRLAVGGLYVTCSCSGLLTEEDFRQLLSKAERRSGRSLHWIARGGLAGDHPAKLEFPEGRYLKGWIGLRE